MLPAVTEGGSGMHGKLAALVAALLFGAAGAAQAASFDCAKARTAPEKQICADKELSRLDDELALAYRDALALTPTRANLVQEQREWLQERDGRWSETPPTRQDIEDSYRFRLQALNARRAIDRRAPKWMMARQLERECVYIAFLHCEVSGSGREPAQGGWPALVYQQQRAGEGESPDLFSGVVLFQDIGEGRLKPVAWAYSDQAELEPPTVIRSPAGPLLLIPGHGLGANRANADVVFRYVDGAWKDVEAQAWIGDLARRLPERAWIAQGVDIDFSRLHAATPVWREQDRECCPTGGSAEAELALSGDRLVVKSVRYRP